uniref:Gag-pol polyprotein n=1 Tax=Solanum tuberosum TaxID=4113 RepID=M1DB29_SOLTU
MSMILFGVFNLVKTKCRNAMLLEDMNIYRLMTHAQQVEGDKLREMAKDNKKARIGNYEYSQKKSGSENRSQFHQSSTAPAPSSASAPSPWFRQDQKGRASGSKSHGSASGNRSFPTCPKCALAAPSSRLTQLGTSSGTGGGQRQTRLYALQARQDHEDYLDV